MKDKIHVEVTKLKKDPQYINAFKERMHQNWSNKEEQVLFEDLLIYFKQQDDTKRYSSLSLIRQKQYILHGELDTVLDRANELIDYYGKNNDKTYLAKNYNELLKACIYKGDYIQGITYAKAALAFIKEGTQQDIHIESLLNLSTFYLLLQEFKKAEETLNQVQNLSELLNDENKVLLARNKAIILLQQEQLDKAMQQCQVAYEIADRLDKAKVDDIGLCFVLCVRGTIFKKRCLNMQAEKDFKEAIKIAQAQGYQVAECGATIAYTYYLQEEMQYDKARESLQKAQTLAMKLNAPYFMAEIEGAYAKLFEKAQKWEAAYKALSKAQAFWTSRDRNKVEVLKLAQDLGSMEAQVDCYKETSKQIQQIAALGQAFAMKLNYEEINKEIFDELSKLIDIDFLGIAYMNEGKLEYDVIDAQGKVLDVNNDIVRYPKRMVEYTTTFQSDLLINDGNFEEYSIKVIKESETKARLLSMMVKMLKINDRVIGAITLGSCKANCYSSHDENIAQIMTSYIAFALNNRMLNKDIKALKEHDALTGLMRRDVALHMGEELFKANHKKHRTTAILLLDIDGFKQMNDKYGHRLGDQILKKAGEVLSDATSIADYIGRYGGEEFIVILNNVTMKEVAKVAENIKVQIESHRFETKRDTDIKITLSGGIYICNEYTLNFADGIRFAEHALYRAKLLGKNRIISYSLTS